MATSAKDWRNAQVWVSIALRQVSSWQRLRGPVVGVAVEFQLPSGKSLHGNEVLHPLCSHARYLFQLPSGKSLHGNVISSLYPQLGRVFQLPSGKSLHGNSLYRNGRQGTPSLVSIALRQVSSWQPGANIFAAQRHCGFPLPSGKSLHGNWVLWWRGLPQYPVSIALRQVSSWQPEGWACSPHWSDVSIALRQVSSWQLLQEIALQLSAMFQLPSGKSLHGNLKQ